MSAPQWLFPEPGRATPEGVGSAWPEKWPHADEPGVYLVLDRHGELLYVGKASINNVLGNRLSEWFKYARDGTKSCEPQQDHWTRRSEFVATIPVAKGFEATGLEEYLISKLQPADNQRGIRGRESG